MLSVVENAAGESGDIDEVHVGGVIYTRQWFPDGHPARTALDVDPTSFIRLKAKANIG